MIASQQDRHHAELMEGLGEIRDAVLAVGGVKTVVIPKPKLTFPDMDLRDVTFTPAPADITEEPPIGSRLTDSHWHVWRRGERGWGIEGLIPGSNFDNPWSTVQQYAPLIALDEPADITEEPPVGSQLTDGDGEVWGRFEAGWQVWDALGYMEWSGVSDPWSVVRTNAPLRPTTDADRVRVGLPVEPAPADYVGGECAECGVPSNGHAVDCMRFDKDAEPAPADERRVNVTITDVYAVPNDYGFLRINVGPETAVIDQNASNVTVTDVEPAPADVDPDEALAMDLYHNSLLIPPVKEIGPTAWISERDHEMWLGVARAAREHIEAERDVRREVEQEAMQGQIEALEVNATLSQRRAVKAEADIARATKERDEQTRDAIEWRNRYDALREDVSEKRWDNSVLGSDRGAYVTVVLRGILDRDDERAES